MALWVVFRSHVPSCSLNPGAFGVHSLESPFIYYSFTMPPHFAGARQIGAGAIQMPRPQAVSSRGAFKQASRLQSSSVRVYAAAVEEKTEVDSSTSGNDSMRNIAIIAHVDHGKTTLVDAMYVCVFLVRLPFSGALIADVWVSLSFWLGLSLSPMHSCTHALMHSLTNHRCWLAIVQAQAVQGVPRQSGSGDAYHGFERSGA